MKKNNYNHVEELTQRILHNEKHGITADYNLFYNMPMRTRAELGQEFIDEFQAEKKFRERNFLRPNSTFSLIMGGQR